MCYSILVNLLNNVNKTICKIAQKWIEIDKDQVCIQTAATLKYICNQLIDKPDKTCDKRYKNSWQVWYFNEINVAGDAEYVYTFHSFYDKDPILLYHYIVWFWYTKLHNTNWLYLMIQLLVTMKSYWIFNVESLNSTISFLHTHFLLCHGQITLHFPCMVRS